MAINEMQTVRDQYRTHEKLASRISLHEKYSVNRQGFSPWILSHLEIGEGASLLELGCGTGEMWRGRGDLVKRCRRFILSDFSEGMVTRAKEVLKDVEGISYRTIDIQDIPFEAESFDVVIANMMLYHVPDLARGLSEVRRVLKDTGTFYTATFGEHGIMEYFSGLFAAYGIRDTTSRVFTLQNGKEKLAPFFADVKRVDYEDSLAVTNLEDAADYIQSLAGMSELRALPRETILSVLKENMDSGVLRVPKEYGLFTASGVPVSGSFQS